MKKYMQQQNRLWDYQVLNQLGRGQYGQVFKVQSKKDNKIFALKKINLSSSHEKQKIQAFRQIKALKLIHHPDIIQYYESFLSMDNIYIVMEYASKGDLSKDIKIRKKKQKNYSEEQLWQMFEAMVKGVKHLHEKNIVHRDIKVENIFITQQNKLKVGDLGMSKIIYQASQLISTRVGTPVYFAPEIIQHQMYSFPVDIWALGCVFYYLAALQHPYKDATIQTLGYYIIDKDPRPIKGTLSPQIISFIMSMLEKNPKTRPDIHQIYKRIKERKQQKVNNRISIFNIKQILALKADKKKYEVAKSVLSAKRENINRQLSIEIDNCRSQFAQSRVENPQSSKLENIKARNNSMYLPQKDKRRSNGNLSPMIKSNGFTPQLMQKLSQSPSPKKHKIGDFLRYQQPLSPQKGYSFRGRGRRPFG